MIVKESQLTCRGKSSALILCYDEEEQCGVGKSQRKRKLSLVTPKLKTTLLIHLMTNQRHMSRQILEGYSKALIGPWLSEMDKILDAVDPVHRFLESLHTTLEFV